MGQSSLEYIDEAEDDDARGFLCPTCGNSLRCPWCAGTGEQEAEYECHHCGGLGDCPTCEGLW